MNMLKLTAAAALVAASLSASAMSSIADEDLSAVAGQDGVSIAANLNINIGSFEYSTNNASNPALGTGSVAFNNIQIGGLVAMTIDIVGASNFSGILNAMVGTTANGTTGATAFETAKLAAASSYVAGSGAGAPGTVGTWYTGTDVVQFAFPNVSVASNAELISVKVGGITMGVNGQQQIDATTGKNTGPSFGSFAINGLDMRGTTVWLWAH